MDQSIIFYTLIGMMLVTYIPRLVPVWFLSSRSLPDVVITWLKYVPVTVLAAMLAPSLFVVDGRLDLALDNLYLMAAIPTFLVAWKTRSLFAAVITGMVLVAGARFFLGM